MGNVLITWLGESEDVQAYNCFTYQVNGSLNGTAGRFEWIVDKGNLTHRMFVNSGTINGRSIVS